MFFANRVPPQAREAYSKDVLSGMLAAVWMGASLPFVAVIAREELKASAFEIGVLTMSPVAGTLLSLLWARMGEGRARIPFVSTSLGIARACFFLFVFATRSYILISIVAAMYFIGSVAGPAYSAVMKEIYPEGDRARIMSYARVCTLCVYIVVTALAAPLLRIVSFRWVFPAAALFGVAGAMVFRSIPEEQAPAEQPAPFAKFVRTSIMALHDNPGFRWFCAGTFIFGAANFMASPIYTIYQVDVLGVDTGWAGIYAVVSAATSILTYFYWGGYIDRKGPITATIIITLSWAAIPVIYSLSTRPWMLLPTAVIAGVMGGGSELAYILGVLHFAPEGRVTQYQALFGSLIGLRGVVAPYIGAGLVQSGLVGMKELFILSAALILVGCAVLVVGARRYP